MHLPRSGLVLPKQNIGVVPLVRRAALADRGPSNLTEDDGKRIIVYPQGRPRTAHWARCDELALKFGADMQRSIDGPFPSVDAFLSHAQRLAVFRDRARSFLFILARTTPLALMVLETRKRIERALPVACNAVWAIFLDPEEDPLFADDASEVGSLEGRPADMPIWTSAAGARFFVLSPASRSSARVGTAASPMVAEQRRGP